MIRAFTGTLGLFLLIALIAGGAYAALSNKQTQTSEALPAPPQEQIVRKAAVARRSVTAGGLRWTVTGASQRTELRSYTYPPETLHGIFMTVDFEVENVSDKPVTLTQDSMHLVKDDVRSPPAADVNSQFVRAEENLLFNEYGLLEPGEKKNGRVNFDLGVPFGITSPSGVSGFAVELGDADPTVEKERTVDLNF